MFSKKDLFQLRERNISKETAEKQIESFRRGFPFARLSAPANRGNGINTFWEMQTHELEALYEKRSLSYRLIKFVPASGAATRMFQSLHEFRQSFDKSVPDENLFRDKGFNSAYNFFQNLGKFAFYGDLVKLMAKKGLDLEGCLAARDYDVILDHVMGEPGLNYSQMPKAVIKFHHYGAFSRTALGEHLVEAAYYCRDKNKKARVHFTVSPEHLEKFKDLLALVKPYYESRYGVKYEVEFSVQKPSTDTIAVDMNNDPFREDDGSLVFRPGGHGALIENLNELDADIVFIKNIDNVVPDRLKGDTYLYKKVIGGLLIKLQEQIFLRLQNLHSDDLRDDQIEETIRFLKTALFQDLPEALSFVPRKEKIKRLAQVLNRPIRVCGMVKNEGEPGGGPFWVEGREGRQSLQIVESSQINLKDPKQKAIVEGSTHFNPVDLVCGIRNFRGERFDLHEFIDPETGFISVKSKNGRQLKALELPGLWNGAMAGWITFFVEVPITTFNPVKTINDLLREQHQA